MTSPRVPTGSVPCCSALTSCVIRTAPCGPTRVPTPCRCFLYSAPRPRSRSGFRPGPALQVPWLPSSPRSVPVRRLQRFPCSTLTCQGACAGRCARFCPAVWRSSRILLAGCRGVKANVEGTSQIGNMHRAVPTRHTLPAYCQLPVPRSVVFFDGAYVPVKVSSLITVSPSLTVR